MKPFDDVLKRRLESYAERFASNRTDLQSAIDKRNLKEIRDLLAANALKFDAEMVARLRVSLHLKAAKKTVTNGSGYPQRVDLTAEENRADLQHLLHGEDERLDLLAAIDRITARRFVSVVSKNGAKAAASPPTMH